MWDLITVSADLVVNGNDDSRGVGEYRGRVIAIALAEDDPAPGEPPDAAATWLLVADDRRDAPVWVSQASVSGQRLGR